MTRKLRWWSVVLLLPAFACGQAAAGRATSTAGALAVTGAAASLADNTCYESNLDDPHTRDRNSFCTGARGGSNPGAAGAVLAVGVGAVIAGKAIELDAQEGARRPSTTALSGTLPGQGSQALLSPAPSTTTAPSPPAAAAPATPVTEPVEAPGPTRERAARPNPPVILPAKPIVEPSEAPGTTRRRDALPSSPPAPPAQH